MRIAGLLCAGIAILTGCSTKLDTKPASTTPTTDLIYALPIRQFDITVTRQLVSCGDQPGEDGEMKIATEIAFEPLWGEDTDYLYAVDPTSLSEVFSSASFEVAFHPDTRFLKTINATVKDEIGPATVSVLKGAAGILGLTMGTGAGGAPYLSCKDAAKKKLDSYRQAKQELEDATARLQDATQSLALRAAVIQRLASASEADQAINAATQAAEAVRDAEQLLEAKLKIFNAAKASITLKDKQTWPKSTRDSNGQIVSSISGAQLDAWLRDSSDSFSASQAAPLFDVYAEIRRGTSSVEPASFIVGSVSETSSIKYRQPERGVLVFKTLSNQGRNKWIDCFSNSTREEVQSKCRTFQIPDSVAKTHDDVFPQLGTVNAVMVRARTFESVSITATFTETGALSGAGYKQSAAPAVAAASLFEQSVAQAVAFEAAREGKVASKRAAEVARLTDLVKIEEANAKLGGPTELATLQAEIALIKARTERDALLAE